MNRIIIITGTILSTLLVLATFLPVLDSNEWWIRVWDFPRLQILVIAALLFVVVAAVAIVRRGVTGAGWLIGAAGLLVAGYQAYKIVPFSPLWQPEVTTAKGLGKDRCLSIFVSNVKMDNRVAAPLLVHLKSHQPDVVIILENDQWWSDQLAPVAAQYQTVIDHPMDNTYGLLFMTRLSAQDVSLRFLTDPKIGSIKARLQLASGQEMMFYGVHPRPPRIGRDTDQRDHELIMIAREVRKDQAPAIVSGDLNDVAWSSTTQLFKQTANALDPRIGRGLYSTFHADHFYMRWPLDHAFHSGQFRVQELNRLGDIGSDHFPLYLSLCATDDIPVGNVMPAALDAEQVQQVNRTTNK